MFLCFLYSFLLLIATTHLHTTISTIIVSSIS